MPAASTSWTCTKTSGPPSSGRMKPNPRSVLKNLTRPVGIIRTQPDVHNKGFVIDSRTVVVSSQNFSPAGIYENRDAGVILESPEIAQYFGPIFDADWAGARPLVVKARARSARKAGGGRATRPTGKKK